MNTFSRLAIIGVGPSAIYLLNHLVRCAEHFDPTLTDIYLFDKRTRLGVGMPYARSTTDKQNLCNISSAEMPRLDISLVDWLHSLSDSQLAFQGIQRCEIDEDQTYCRITLGDYFHNQYTALVKAVRSRGVNVHEFPRCQITDVIDHQPPGDIEVRFGDDDRVVVDRVVIATGHSFDTSDEPSAGYFASPWPMQKLIPNEDEFCNFEIGTLGASLSAFDVVASLSHRHGSFATRDGQLAFEASPGSEGFKIILHSSEGCLPHLQYEQVEPFREIYRHVDRGTLMAIRDDTGCLSLDEYFHQVCRPALATAFKKDARNDIVELLGLEHFPLEDFIAKMSDEHTADDPFSLMRSEMPEANRLLRKGIPIHWKETLDDLMFTLNFHFDMLAAEDHLRYRKVIVPFLMNVIAAIPLHSAQIILALHDAGKLELISGTVTVKKKTEGKTLIEVESCDRIIEREYRMFVDCSGQESVDFKSFPFKSLADRGTVSEAVAGFRDRSCVEHLTETERTRVVNRDGRPALRLGGIAIDGYYRVIGEDGSSNERIYDIAFPHATGARPYSYGLQACDAAASIVVQAWCERANAVSELTTDLAAVTEAYNDLTAPS